MTAPRPTVRLVARIYLLSLTTIAAIGVALVLVAGALRPPQMQRLTDYLTDELARRQGDPEALRAAVERLHGTLGAAIAYHDADGRRLAAAGDPPPLPDDRTSRSSAPAGMHVATARSDGRVVGHGVFVPGAPTIPFRQLGLALALVFTGLAIGAVLLARSLTRPIGRLTAAARSLGAGDLQARVGAMPPGEFHELGATFDDMAGRVDDLVRSQRELLASVSHELRTPIARIRVALDLSAEGDPGALLGLTDDLGQLERLIDDVLTASRLALPHRGGTGEPLRRETIDLVRLVARAAAGFETTFTSHPLRLELPAHAVPIAADAGLLRRVIDNLLDNARKYSEPGRTIGLRLHLTGERAVLVVEDHGIGIDPADLARLGTPFFRGERSRSRSTGGVGLGITLARRIVEAHAGELEIDSRVGEGTRVSVRLPWA